MRYDKRRIIEYADCLEIADMLGIEKNIRGSRVYIACPEHMKNTGRKESKIDNCSLNQKGYYCFSCLAKGSVIDLVKNHLDTDEEEACRIISAMLGDESMFQYEEAGLQMRLPFNKEELASIGLLCGITAEYPVFDCPRKENVPPDYKISKKTYADRYTYVKTEYVSLLNLMKEDPEGFIFMMEGKLKEAEKINDFIIQSGLLKLFDEQFELSYFVYAERIKLKKEARLHKQIKERLDKMRADMYEQTG